MISSTVEGVGLLLLIAAAVAIVARRLRLPYTVGLTVAGILVSLLPNRPDLHLTRNLIYDVFLPPLLFEAALQMEWPRFKSELPVTVTLSTLGVLLSAAFVSAGVFFILRWSWPTSLMSAILLSATDPVAIIASFKDLKIGGRLQMLVESESLLNDGTAAVLFGLAATLFSGGEVSGWRIVIDFVVTVGGGALCGALIAGAALLLAGRAADHLVEITLTVIAAFGSFLLAERFHVSGVLATMTAGIIVGNSESRGFISSEGHGAIEAFWEYAAFVVNSLIFLLIGLTVADQPFSKTWIACVAVIFFATAGRAIAVYGCAVLFSRSRLRLAWSDQHVLFWAGLKGALALALALGLRNDFPGKADILSVTFAVVAFSVVVQGVTVPPLLSRLKLTSARP